MSSSPQLVVGIGASAGGLEACRRLFAEMPAESGMAFVVVTESDGAGERTASDVLENITGMTVVRVSEAEPLRPNHVYVTAPNSSAEIRDGMLRPKPRERAEGAPVHPIDALFCSLAEDQSDHAAAIVLSGTGDDGAAGIQAVKAEGGLCIAQDPETAQCDGMPRSTIATGSTDYVVPPEHMPAILVEFAHRHERADAKRPSERRFFRSAGLWNHLATAVLPALLARSVAGESIRVWIPCCGTGEAAYSLAILMLEQAANAVGRTSFKLFATSASEADVANARRGIYPAAVASDVGSRRLQRFFVPRNGSLRVANEVRASVTFGVHRLLVDPPFSKLDLVVLLDPPSHLADQHDAVLELFYFALASEGLLALETPELAERRPDLFQRVSTDHPVFRRVRTVRGRGRQPDWFERVPGIQPRDTPTAPLERHGRSKLQWVVEQFVLSRHASACAAINRKHELLYLFGPTNVYLSQPIGELRADLMAWVKPGMKAKLEDALREALETRRPANADDIVMERGGAAVPVDVCIEPVSTDSGGEDVFLVVFKDAPAQPGAGEPDAPAGLRSLVEALEAELSSTKYELGKTVEELERSTENHSSSNEELLSLTQELQSRNGELEASREELRSVNQEFVTVNRQLQLNNAELEAANADLGNLLGSMPVPTIFLDGSLAIRRFNSAATEVMHLVPSDVGRSIEHVKERFHDESMLADVAKAIERSVPVSAELATDEGRWYQRTVFPFRTLEGRIDGVTITFAEVTGQKAAAARIDQARRLAEAILATVRTPLLVLNAELCVISANKSFCEVFGVRREEVENRNVYELAKAQWNTPELHALLDRAMHGEREIRDHLMECEVEHIGRRVLLLNTRPMVDSVDGLLLVSIEDITERHRAEQLIRQRSEELTEEHHRKDEFLAMLGHELRNPLSALTHGLELLGRVPDDSQRSEQLRAMMSRQTKRISSLLDQLLDVARVISGKIEVAQNRLDFREVVHGALETVASLVESRQQRLNTREPEQAPVWVLGDPVRLSQAIENLLTNASKYTPVGGNIWVSLETPDGEARLGIRDDGIGMDPQLLPHIFELFTQGPRQLDRAQGGLGLGLPLMKRLIELYGGRVEASSAGLGKGSEFVVTLPLAAETADSERKPFSPGPTSRRVLLVDDERDTAEALTELLTMQGHDVRAAHDGPAALEAVREFAPEVVLLDLGLPGMDGYEVASAIRREHGDALFLVALTGYHKDTARLEKAGFDEHLIKPPSMEKLEELLTRGKTRRP